MVTIRKFSIVRSVVADFDNPLAAVGPPTLSDDACTRSFLLC